MMYLMMEQMTMQAQKVSNFIPYTSITVSKNKVEYKKLLLWEMWLIITMTMAQMWAVTSLNFNL